MKSDGEARGGEGRLRIAAGESELETRQESIVKMQAQLDALKDEKEKLITEFAKQLEPMEEEMRCWAGARFRMWCCRWRIEGETSLVFGGWCGTVCRGPACLVFEVRVGAAAKDRVRSML